MRRCTHSTNTKFCQKKNENFIDGKSNHIHIKRVLTPHIGSNHHIILRSSIWEWVVYAVFELEIIGVTPL